MTDLNQAQAASPSAEAPAPLPYFKDNGVALKELRKLEPPFTEEKRATFVENVAKSPMAKPIAFSILALGWTAKTDARWNFIRSGMRQILLGNREYPEGKQLSDTRVRRAWLASEFNTDHRTSAAKTYLEDFSYLRPLYIILGEPDNDGWVDTALTDFLGELDGAIEVAGGKPPKKPATKISVGQQLAWQISRHIPSKANGHKALRSHLRLLQVLATLQQEKGERLELASRQVATLDGLLTDTKAEVAKLEEAVEEARARSTAERVRADDIARQLTAANEQQVLQKGVADAKLVDELNAQRAAMRAYLREKIQNVRLYADRTEPARDKIARLCDEMVSFLDDSSRPHK
jgi:hypothetical protein